mgnify:CR=1 FL=1
MEPSYAVKIGGVWQVRRLKDNCTVGYINDDLVQVIPIGGGMLQGVDKKGKIYLYTERGAFIRNVY